jgi:hypothetical protein
VVTLQTLRVVREHRAAFDRFLDLLLRASDAKQFAAFTANTTSALQTLQLHESLVDQIGCYVNSYGMCGVALNADALKRRLEAMAAKERAAQLTLKAITQCFDADLAPFGTSLQVCCADRMEHTLQTCG